MKLSKLLTESKFSKYEEFEDALIQAKQQNNYHEFENIISTALKSRQWEWFGRYYQIMDGPSHSLTKEVFKKVTPF